MRYHIFETPRRICLDLDPKPVDSSHPHIPSEEWNNRYLYLKSAGLVKNCRWFESRTPGHAHCIIDLPRPLSADRRAWISLFLFSDPWRAVAGVLRTELKERLPMGPTSDGGKSGLIPVLCAGYVIRHQPYKGIKADLICDCPEFVCKECGKEELAFDHLACRINRKTAHNFEPEKLVMCRHIWQAQKHRSFKDLAAAFRKTLK
jgi:hypothetical protein